jgi:hypothetical protein
MKYAGDKRYCKMEKSMYLRRLLSVLLISAAAVCSPSLLSAQTDDPAPKVEVFGGYSWYRSGGTIDSKSVPSFEKGWAGQFAYNLNRWGGFVVEANGHYNGGYGNTLSFAAGPQFKWRTDHFTPFVETFVGVQHISPKLYPDQYAAEFLVGGGLDIKLTQRFSVRPVQFDYVNTSYTKLSSPGLGNPLNGARLQAGFVFSFAPTASEESQIVNATCSATPNAVVAGDFVKIDVSPSGFNPKRTLTYSYTSTGGKVSMSDATAEVDTAGLAPGSYTVEAKVADSGKGAHQRTASCQVAFSINKSSKAL